MHFEPISRDILDGKPRLFMKYCGACEKNPCLSNARLQVARLEISSPGILIISPSVSCAWPIGDQKLVEPGVAERLPSECRLALWNHCHDMSSHCVHTPSTFRDRSLYRYSSDHDPETVSLWYQTRGSLRLCFSCMFMLPRQIGQPVSGWQDDPMFCL